MRENTITVRQVAAMAAGDAAADTYGWDTVFAVSFADVNAAIAVKKSSPKAFNQEVDDDDTKVKIEGTFDDWRVCTGGDGQNLWMELPIPRLALSGSFSGEYKDVLAVIEVKLNLIPQEKASPTKGNNALKLRAGSRDEKAVVVRSLDLGKDIGPVKTGLVQFALERWLNLNTDKFAHTFASVDLDRELADEIKGMKWLMPTHTSYAVSDLGTLENSVFGVLSMTEDREPTRLNHQVSANAIPNHARAGFLISRERFLSKMVLPSMPALFKGATLDDFFIGDDGASVSNSNVITVQDLKLDDGTVVSPKLKRNDLSVSVSETKLMIQFTDLHFEYSPGIDVYIQYSASNIIDIDKDKRITLKLHQTTHKGTVTTSLNKQIIEIATAIAGVLIGAALGIAIPGAGEVIEEGGVVAGEAGSALIENTVVDFSEALSEETIGLAENDVNPLITASEEVTTTVGESSNFSKFTGWLARNSAKIKGGLIGSTVGGAVGGIAGKIPSILEAVATGQVQNLPTLERFASTAVAPITWPGQSKFTLMSAALNHSLQIGCHPGFADG